MRLLPWRPSGWTVDDLRLLPRGDGCKYELIDGALWVEPPPPPEHARALERLAGALTDAAAGTDLSVTSWRPSSPRELDELDELDDGTEWIGVDEPDVDGWRVEDLDRVPPHVWLELVDGGIHLLPEPTAEHQAVVHRLATRLSAATPNVRVQEDVVLHGRTWLRPDVVVGGGAGHARLVIEVSDDTTDLVDRHLRPALWADAGAQEFWRLRLDPLELTTSVREGSSYRETGRYADEVTMDGPLRLHVRLSELRGGS